MLLQSSRRGFPFSFIRVSQMHRIYDSAPTTGIMGRGYARQHPQLLYSAVVAADTEMPANTRHTPNSTPFSYPLPPLSRREFLRTAKTPPASRPASNDQFKEISREPELRPPLSLSLSLSLFLPSSFVSSLLSSGEQCRTLAPVRLIKKIHNRGFFLLRTVRTVGCQHLGSRY